MSTSISTSQIINQTTLNSSSSKQLFSFPKADRFPALTKSLNDKVAYDLPEVRTARAAAMGYGTRTTFGATNKTPSPTSYTLPSEFIEKARSKAFSFGISRDAYNKVYIKENPPKDKNIPGPGAYNSPKIIGEEAAKFSLRMKTIDPAMETTVKFNPGPGRYEDVASMSPKGKYFLSKLKNSGAPTICPPKLERFKDYSGGSKNKNPGPGYYAPKVELSKNGDYFISSFKSSGCRTFSHSERNLSLSNTKNIAPGPGSYRYASDFGFYMPREQSTAEYSPNAKSSIRSSAIMKTSASASILKPMSSANTKEAKISKTAFSKTPSQNDLENKSALANNTNNEDHKGTEEKQL